MLSLDKFRCILICKGLLLCFAEIVGMNILALPTRFCALVASSALK